MLLWRGPPDSNHERRLRVCGVGLLPVNWSMASVVVGYTPCLRSSWRRTRDRGSLRDILEKVRVDEDAICVAVREILSEEREKAEADADADGQPAHGQAVLQKAAQGMHDRLYELCGNALLTVDNQRMQIASSGSEGLRRLELLGLLPPSLEWRTTFTQPSFMGDLYEAFDETLDQRLSELQYRCSRRAMSSSYKARRAVPAAYALPEVEHVLGAAEARRLRDGVGLDGVLVLDPQPSLLSKEQMSAAADELLECAPSGSNPNASLTLILTLSRTSCSSAWHADRTDDC
jgi:hypothetical protein